MENIYCVCQQSDILFVSVAMITAFTGNMAKEVYNVLIVRLKKKVTVQSFVRNYDKARRRTTSVLAAQGLAECIINN